MQRNVKPRGLRSLKCKCLKVKRFQLNWLIVKGKIMEVLTKNVNYEWLKGIYKYENFNCDTLSLFSV